MIVLKNLKRKALKPNLKQYRELAREYAARRGRTIPFQMHGYEYTLKDIVKSFKKNSQWFEFKNNKWKILDKYFPEFNKEKK